jgi:hypothetical protein
VTCGNKSQCAYRLKIEQLNGTAGNYTTLKITNQSSSAPAAGSSATPLPPGPIISQDYTNGRVFGKGFVKYYYFAVNATEMGDAMILLNKTQIHGIGANGDSKLLVNIQKNTDEPVSRAYRYTNWDFPTEEAWGITSASGKRAFPEIVEVCADELHKACAGATGCGLVVGVVGQTDQVASSYRLRGFYGKNKLYVDKPRKVDRNVTRPAGQQFDYYWFVIDESVWNATAVWEYQVSVGTEGNGDPDLYVSLMDGSEPTENDFTLASNMQGADSVRIASN